MKKPGQRALRKGRVSIEGFVYHITFSTHNRQPLINFKRGCQIAQKFHTYFAVKDDSLLCWVLMPDHVHLLIDLGPNSTLEQIVRSLKSSTSRLFRDEKPFWQTGYFDRAMRKEDDLEAVSRYIVANPIRAGLTQSVKEYPFWDAVWF
jgi:REP element-mobilizing transposase RayT